MYKNPYEIYASLVIKGKARTHEALTEEIKVSPSKCYNSGDKKRKNIDVFYDENGWVYTKRSLSGKESVNDIIMDLINDVKHSEEVLKDISSNMKVALSIAIYRNTDWPIMQLSNSVIVFFSDIGATIDFDIYS